MGAFFVCWSDFWLVYAAAACTDCGACFSVRRSVLANWWHLVHIIVIRSKSQIGLTHTPP